MKRLYLFTLFLMFASFGWSQNLTGILDRKPVEVSGGLKLGLSFYETTRDKPQYSPLSYSINANATISLYGIAIPFTFIYSEKQRSFRQPFNKIGASPQYKWIKVHVGQRNVNFNPYTLAGKTFLGYGVELNPGKLRVGFVKGRFNREVRNLAGIESFIQPSFERNGWAAQLGFGSRENHFDISLLRAVDDLPSERNTEQFGNLKAEENIVLGIQGTLTFLKSMSVALNIAGSAFTENQLSREFLDEDVSKLLPRAFFTPKLNSTLKFAGDIKAKYSSGNFNLSAGYKRIESDFKSMGAYRFLTDIEDFTLSPSFSILKRQIRISGTYGIQRNNLSGLKLQTSNRTIGSLNVNYQSKDNFSTSLLYSNYKTDVISIDDEILSDSFDIIQVSENVNIRFQIPFGSKKVNSLGIYGGQQKFNRELNQNEVDPLSISRNVNIMWNHRPSKEGIGYSIGLNATNITGRRTQQRMGGRMSVNKTIVKKVKLSLNTGAFLTRIEDVNAGLSFNSSLRMKYKVSKKQSVNFSFRFLNRNNKISEAKSYTDFRSQLNYSIRF